MVTGWNTIGGKTYYMKKSDGTCATGWCKIDDKTYYFYSDCSMAVSTTIDGYTIGADGVWTGN